MSIALDSNRRIVSSVFSQSGIPSYCSVLNTKAIVPVVMAPAPAPAVELDRCNSFSSSSSSSIGKNSDFSDDEGDNEAESSLVIDSLEEVLPIRRGISDFYNGKSKSFTSLADVSFAASIREIAKPENAYSRKRRNLLVSNLVWDKNKASLLKGNNNGISKRSIRSSRSSLALAVAMSSRDESNSNLSSFHPPLHSSGRAFRSNLASAVPPMCKYPAFRS